MAYRFDVEKLDEKGKELREYSEFNIEDRLIELRKFKDTVQWKGLAKDTYFETFDESLKDIDELNYIMKRLGYYLQFAAENYSQVLSDSHGEFEKYVQMMELDGKKVEGDKNV